MRSRSWTVGPDPKLAPSYHGLVGLTIAKAFRSIGQLALWERVASVAERRVQSLYRRPRFAGPSDEPDSGKGERSEGG